MRVRADRERLFVRIDFEEDLWLLRSVLRPGDIVEGITMRSISIGGRRSERRQVRVKLRIKDVEFQPFTGRLRIFGIIVEGPEEYGLRGKHHAMTVSVGQNIVVERDSGWSPSIVKRLSESGPRGRAILVAIDYDEYAIALLSPVGFRVLAEDYAKLPGKTDPSREEATRKLIEEVSRHVVEHSSRNDAVAVIVVGPGNLKNEVAARIRELKPGIRVYTDNVAMGGRAGLEEAIRRPNIMRELKGYYILEAEGFLEKFLALIAKNPGKTAQGLEEVKRALEIGAVDALALTDSLFYSEQVEDLGQLIELAYKTRAKVIMVPEDSPPGDKIKRMGEILAILRFPIPRA
ncbi:MAG: mRNA surveillance protein Pelota [Desulfurococcales archaeon]|nr:mRNA surveillance protein Pelota [Desulfurococcales archaeon]